MELFNSGINEPIIVINHNTPVQDPIEREIMALANLQNGWDYGEGSPPSDETIIHAKDIYQISKKYNLFTEVFPIGHGEILLSFSKDDIFVDILLKQDGTFQLTTEIGIGDRFERGETIEHVRLDTINAKLKELSGVAECTVSESCASDPIVRKSSVSSLKALEIWSTQYQLLLGSVFSGSNKQQYALI